MFVFVFLIRVKQLNLVYFSMLIKINVFIVASLCLVSIDCNVYSSKCSFSNWEGKSEENSMI